MASGSEGLSLNRRGHETVFPQTFHVVERPDVRDAIVDLAVWRAGRRGRAGQPLFSHPGRKIDPSLGFERRWVIYNGVAEATRMPPSWNGWMHHSVESPRLRRITSPANGKSRIYPT